MLYNKKYNNYVLIWHADGPTDQDIINWINQGMPGWDYSYSYSRAQIGFAVSDSPFGPYKLVNVQRMHHVSGWDDEDPGMARDMTVWKEENETAYAIYSSEGNRFLYVSRLDDTYTTWAVPNDQAQDGVDFKGRILDTEWREAPAIFKHNGYYYLMTSGTSGWSPNAAIYHRATDLYGPWENLGNPCDGDGYDTTFESQAAFFVQFDSSKGQIIYFGDRWISWDLYSSKYIWLPVEINEDDNRITLHWSWEWQYEDVFTENGVNISKEHQKFVPQLKTTKNTNNGKLITIICSVVGVVSLLSIITIVFVFHKRPNNINENYNQI